MGKRKASGKSSKTNGNTCEKHIEARAVLLYRWSQVVIFLAASCEIRVYMFQLDNPFHSHLGIVLCESEGV